MGKKRIHIVEVGPRDGFQSVKTFIDTNQKLEIVDRLVKAGVDSMEVCSFVHPKAIPQMVDAATVAETVVARYPKLRAIALVPNMRGAENAVEAGIREISCVISASEAHNKANVNRTIDASVQALGEIRDAFSQVRVRLDIATAFGCPFSGKTPYQDVLSLIRKVDCMGISEFVLCDTIGVANPRQVMELVEAVEPFVPTENLTMHFHNTRGMGLANIFAAVEKGLTSFESCIGGLGGCPFAPGSEGNAATEDVAFMLQEMGYETGLDISKLKDAVRYLSENVDAKITGKILLASAACGNGAER